jgi:type I restriction enzyme S subunit
MANAIGDHLWPADWGVATVREIASISTGARDTQDRKRHGQYPFFVRSQKVERIDSWSYDGEAVLTAGDGVGTGKVYHYINGRFDYHQRVYKMSDFAPNCDGKFFYYYFSAHFRSRVEAMTAKSSVDSVRMETIAGMPIPLPPLSEQKRIAEALSDVDDLILAIERVLAKKRDVRLSATLQLFLGETRLPGFAGEWTVHTLRSLGTFLKGRGIKRDDVQTRGVPCIRYGELYTRYVGYVSHPVACVSPDVAASALPLVTGDLLFTASGETAAEIGTCVAYTGQLGAVAGGDIIVLRAHGQDPVFLAGLMNASGMVEQKSRLGQGDAVAHISAHALGGIAVKLPAIEEQRAIAAVVRDLDSDINALEARLAKTQDIKQGMMQELLIGRRRLRELERIAA